MPVLRSLLVLASLVACTDAPDPKDDTEVPNTAPTVEGVLILPADPMASDTITCTALGYEDAEGDANNSRVQWQINGRDAGDEIGLAGGFRRGDVVTCTLTPSDGRDDGAPVSGEVTVINSPPTLGDARITPALATAHTPLTCSLIEFRDPDGDPDLSTYAWTIDGALIGEGPTLESGYAFGDRVTCTITPSDGSDTLPLREATVTISNSRPTLASVTVEPADPTALSTLTCAHPPPEDADGETVSVAYGWLVNGAPRSQGSATFSGQFSRGDEVSCTVEITDGLDSDTLSSAEVLVLNTPPGAATFAVLPDPADEDDALRCLLDQPAVDADGDPITYQLSWTVDGLNFPAVFPDAVGPITDLIVHDTIPADDTAPDETWTCSVTPTDGYDPGPTTTASLTLLPPVEVRGPSSLGPEALSLSTTFMLAQAITLPDAQYLDGLGVWVAAGAGPVTMALYDSQGGMPGTRVATTQGYETSSVGGNTFALQGGRVLLPAGTYWIALHHTGSLTIGGRPGFTTTAYTTPGGGSTLPATFNNALTFLGRPYDLYLMVR